MRVKFGSIVTSGSGSLGGHTIQNSKGGMQLRTKPSPLNNPSSLQLRIRSINKELQSGWRNLTDFQRSTWNIYAENNVTFLKKGDITRISGHALWLKYNFGYLFDYLPVITSPYDYKSVRLGDELIINGGFIGQAPWITSLYWTFFPGYVSYINSGPGYISQPVSISLNVNYQIRFSLFAFTGLVELGFFNQSVASLFYSPYTYYISLSNYSQIWNATSRVSASFIRIYSRTFSCNYSLTGVSIRQIL